MSYTLNPAQVEARALIKSKEAKYVLLRGGTGSGKTVIALDCVIERAMHAPKSRHLCLRSTRIDAETSLFGQTFRDVINLKLPTNDGMPAWDFLYKEKRLRLDAMELRLPNDSLIRFAGLDDGKLDRILGPDYATIFINEVSLIERYEIIDTLRTRLRQKVMNNADKPLSLKFIMDCNPPSKLHWTYPAFYQGLNPNTNNPHSKPEQWTSLKMNGSSNAENLGEGYLEDLEDLDHIGRTRFVLGDWFDDVQNPMFYSKDIAEARLEPRRPPTEHGSTDCDDLMRIEVAVDPAASSKPGSDETGIIVVGRDRKNHAYVLEDLSGVYQPTQWAEQAVKAYHRWKADQIVAEKNMGGEMVSSTILAYDPNAPVHLIHASLGKELRAGGASVAYKQRRVHHCGRFDKLENQLLGFETGYDRRKKGSPDRLDALVHGLNSILLAPPVPTYALVQRNFGKQFWKTG